MSDFIYHYEAGQTADAPTILALHGTGGTEFALAHRPLVRVLYRWSVLRPDLAIRCADVTPNDAELCEALLDLGRVQRLLNFRVQAVDDVARRFGRSHHANPEIELGAGNTGLRGGGYIRKRAGAA